MAQFFLPVGVPDCGVPQNDEVFQVMTHRLKNYYELRTEVLVRCSLFVFFLCGTVFGSDESSMMIMELPSRFVSLCCFLFPFQLLTRIGTDRHR